MSTQEWFETKRLLRRTLGFIAPIILVLGFPFVVMWRAGEFTSISQVTRSQLSDRPVLFGLAYSDPKRFYKIQSASLRSASIVSLGTSRTLEFSSAFFRDPSRFYNMGGTGGIPYDVAILRQLIAQGHAPRILILGLDQDQFNAVQAQIPIDFLQDFDKPAGFMRIFFMEWVSASTDLWHRKISLARLFSAPKDKIGLTAILHGSGFYNDGRYYWGIADDPSAAAQDSQYGIGQAIDAVRAGTQISSHGGSTPDAGRIQAVRQILELCAAHDIHVVAFLPPLAHALVVELKRSESDAAYFFRLHQDLAPLFADHDFSFFDFSDPQEFGSSDLEMIDATHGSEKMYARLLIQMAAHDAILKEEIDTDALGHSVASSSSDYLIAPR